MEDMLKADPSVLFLFLYLLPGFLGMVVYGYFREGRPIQNFDRVVIAFVLALVSNLAVHLTFGGPFVPASQTASPDIVLRTMVNVNLLLSSVAAVLIATIVAMLNNHDLIHKALIRLKISNRRSNNDVWYDVFYRHRAYWVKLEFKDGRSLVGWAQYYSASGSPRELFVADAVWSLPNEAGDIIAVDIAGPGVYIPNLEEISTIAILN
jgi:hypothetical protein